jgi:hypothetical protein
MTDPERALTLDEEIKFKESKEKLFVKETDSRADETITEQVEDLLENTFNTREETDNQNVEEAELCPCKRLL